MKIKEIIYPDEYIYSTVPEDAEFSKITTTPSEADCESVLIITNSKKEINLSQNNPPAAIICDMEAIIPEGFATVRVENSRIAAAFAYYRFARPDLSKMKIIGITGTNGKTSTASFTRHILSHCGYKVGFIGTGRIEIDGELISDSNYSMTTPDPSLLYNIMKEMEQKGCDAIVMEVSSHALALHKVAPICFDYALFTNLSPEHTDFHENMENYFRAKIKLFSQTKKAIFNIDDEYGRRAYEECACKKLGVGALWRRDAWVTSLQNNGLSGIAYIYNQKNFSFKLKLKTPGSYNVYNSLLAMTLCIDMGCKPCKVKEALEEIETIPGRFEIIKDEVTVIIDYAHTDCAFNNIMKDLHDAKGNSRLWVIFGCGGERDRRKRPKMAEIAEKYADKIIVTTDNSRGEDPKDIISDIIRGFKNTSYEINENRENAIKTAILSANKGDFVAIIGKGCEKYNIDSKGYHDFDEKAIVRAALEKRKLCE